jgi:uncharacterized protein DUF6170
MVIYFSSNNIPALKTLTLKQKRQAISAAEAKLSAPEKLIINLLKLLIIVPMFLYLTWLDGWQLALPVIAAMSAYFLLYRPVFLGVINKHLK